MIRSGSRCKSKRLDSQPPLVLAPVARFVPRSFDELRSAATMLFTPTFHRRPVGLYELGGTKFFVHEVALSALGEPVWVRLLPADPTVVGRWVYFRKGTKDQFVRGLHEPVYLFHDFDGRSLSAAISDAINEGYEVTE